MSKEENPLNVFSFIADFEGTNIADLFTQGEDGVVPLLPVSDVMLFPGVICPVRIASKAASRLLREVQRTDGYFCVVSQKDHAQRGGGADSEADGLDIYDIGVLARVARIIDLPGDSRTVMLQSFGRCRVNSIVSDTPFYKADITRLEEELPDEDNAEFKALSDTIREQALNMFKLNIAQSDPASFVVKNIKNAIYLVNFLSTTTFVSLGDRYRLLCDARLIDRAYDLLSIINRECQYGQLRKQIQRKTHEDLDQQQREYFLHQQIKTIREELGEYESSATEIDQLRATAAKLQLPLAVRDIFERTLRRLSTMNQQMPDYGVELGYAQTIVTLPWGKASADKLSQKRARRILGRDHYGMQPVKERILEHLAMMQFRIDSRKSPILCLYGAPGVGKTSLGKSIAEALGRKYVRISLGGLHDEAEIRGHRRTYVGAMMGRIMKSMVKAGTDNPVFILDEIDKVTANMHHGDPQSALLEVLDPEQNNAFHDNYLDFDYDLSQVFFIATTNNINTIPPALLDRMELIRVDGYNLEEKREIARRHLIPAELGALDFGAPVKFSPSAIETIVKQYTNEEGVRGLKAQIARVVRRIAKDAAEHGQLPEYALRLKPEDILRLLGNPLEQGGRGRVLGFGV
ncbi:MAG: AAA family ATPase [Bacteroidales bacterium]|nr:AAA family ATPase [Candidatus Equimonas enterica]